jgi:hypothetical protein
MDLYMSAIVAARVAGWRERQGESEDNPLSINFDFGLCVERASESDLLNHTADLARKAIEAVDANMKFHKKLNTWEKIDKLRERRGLGSIWDDGLTL